MNKSYDRLPIETQINEFDFDLWRINSTGNLEYRLIKFTYSIDNNSR